MGAPLAVLSLATYFISLGLSLLQYLGYVAAATMPYAIFGFIYDLFMVPSFIRYRFLSTIAYWIAVYPICRLPHELFMHAYYGYTIFSSFDVISLTAYIVFHGFIHGVVFGALIMMFLRLWSRRFR